MSARARGIAAGIAAALLVSLSATGCSDNQPVKANLPQDINNDPGPIGYGVDGERVITVNGVTYCLYNEDEEGRDVCNGLEGDAYGIDSDMEYDDDNNGITNAIIVYLWYATFTNSHLKSLQKLVKRVNQKHVTQIQRNHHREEARRNGYPYYRPHTSQPSISRRSPASTAPSSRPTTRSTTGSGTIRQSQPAPTKRAPVRRPAR